MLYFKYVIVLVFLIQCSESKLPSFIQTCNRNRPDLSQCCEDNANRALPYVLEGIDELNLSPLRNMKLPKIHGPSNHPYVLNFDGILLNLEGTVFNESEFDVLNLVEYGKLHFPKLELQGKYKIHGFLNDTSIAGKGIAKVTLHGASLKAIWIFEKYQINGVDHMKVASSSLADHNVHAIEYQFENLYSRDRNEGEKMNDFLNENWRLLQENFSPYVHEFILNVMFEVANKVLDSATFDEIFPL